MMNIFSKIRRRFMLTCEEVNDFIIDYLEDRLDERTKTKFEQHIARCQPCQTYLDQYRQTVEMVREEGTIELDEPPEQLVESTLAFLEEHYDDER